MQIKLFLPLSLPGVFVLEVVRGEGSCPVFIVSPVTGLPPHSHGGACSGVGGRGNRRNRGWRVGHIVQVYLLAF